MNLLQGILAAITGGQPAHILNGKPEGATGTNNGATPPAMVGSPNGLVPYSSTIGADKPYAGATHPAPTYSPMINPPAFAPLAHAPIKPMPGASIMRDMLLRIAAPHNVSVQGVGALNSPEPQGHTNPGAMPLQSPGMGGFAANLQPAGNPQDSGYYQL